MTGNEHGAAVPCEERAGPYPPGWLLWEADTSDQYDRARHRHIDPADGLPLEHRHVWGTTPHDHQPAVDLSAFTDTDLEREVHKRQAAASAARAEAAHRELLAVLEAEQAREAAFIESTGITREQYEKVQDYLWDKWEEER